MIWPDSLPVNQLRIPIENAALRAESDLGQYVHSAPFPVILYDEDITDEIFRDTVIGHEVAEAWLENSGAANWLSNEQKEAICDGIGPFIAQLAQELAQDEEEE